MFFAFLGVENGESEDDSSVEQEKRDEACEMLVQRDIVTDGEEEVVLVMSREETQLGISYLHFTLMIQQSITQHPQRSSQVDQIRLIIETLEVKTEEGVVD